VNSNSFHDSSIHDRRPLSAHHCRQQRQHEEEEEEEGEEEEEEDEAPLSEMMEDTIVEESTR
jgi:hypothetical protein